MRVIRSPRPSLRWTAELLWRLSLHRIALRYKETLFGFGWIFLQPITLTVIFTYIFQRFAPIPVKIPYPLFAATGLVSWSLTALVVSQSAICLTSQSSLLKRITLPRILFPLSVVVSSIADLGVMVLLLIGLFFYYQHSPSWEIAWALPLLIIHLLFLFGLSCLVSLANVFLKDIGHALPFLLQIWFFASPVFYPASMVPREFKVLALWNPMTGLIEGYRAALLFGQQPPLDSFVPSMIVTILVLAIGLFLFRKVDGVVADLL